MKAMRLCATLILSAIAAASVRVAAQSSPPASSLPVTAGAVSPAQGPIIQVDRVEYDFGRVTSSEKIRHTYILTNAGNQLLEIANVHPGCHCTTAGDWTHKIAPGQSGEITVQLDTIGMNGPVTRTIEVTSNAKNEPRKTLLLTLTSLLQRRLHQHPARRHQRSVHHGAGCQSHGPTGRHLQRRQRQRPLPRGVEGNQTGQGI